jgi:Methyltransferase domain
VTASPAATHNANCPVCGGGWRPVLSLPAQPIYQHPVPADVVVPLPHTIDLNWVACTDCAHAWQPKFDAGLLERIYRSHYYTPSPDGIAVQFRNDFLSTLESFGLMRPRRVLLEIGASGGDVLAYLRTRTAAPVAYAFEPNIENAAVARSRGLDVRQQFFGEEALQERLDPADLIYSRHVIEHVFRFDDFFAGLNGVVAATADLVLETPSLDHHASRGSITPFQVEHVHVFSRRSLARLASGHGWNLQQAAVTTSGNLIASFRRGQTTVEIPPPALEELQASVARQQRRLQSLFAGRQLVFWGAGSAGVKLANTIGREPDIWTDGNPNKMGKRFVGLKRRIVSPEVAFAEVRSRAFSDPILVIASAFVEEILVRIRQMGWSGEIFDMSGNPVINRPQ